jgi:HEAT repeat protein
MRHVAFFLLLLALCACRQGNEPVDLQALAGKARGGDNAALSKLVELLAVDANGVNAQVYSIVTELGAGAVPALLKKVNSPDKSQREHVIAALGSLRAQEAITPISQILGDKSLGRRYVAAWALGEIGEPAGIPALLSALNDDDSEVRKYATRALIKLNQSAVEPLIAYLATAPPQGGAGAIRALGDIADPRALGPLLAQVEGVNREEVFLALGKLKDPRAEGALLKGLTDLDWKARMKAAMALGPVGSTAAVVPLQKTLEDDVHVVREWSARSLEVITGQHLKYRNEKGEYVTPYSIYH